MKAGWRSENVRRNPQQSITNYLAPIARHE